MRRDVSVVKAATTALLFLHAATRGIHGKRLDHVAARIDREYFAHVCTLLQAVFTFKLKLLRLELVTLLHEIVESLLAAHFYRSM